MAIDRVSGAARRVLVVGGNGMLGREVVRVLSSTPSVDVVATSRQEQAVDRVFFDAESGPVGVHDLLQRVGSVDWVVNCTGVLAAEIDPTDAGSLRRAVVVNSVFPQELAVATGEHGARVVHVSTDGVFRPDAGPCFEDSERFATDAYGVTKRMGEPPAPNALSLRCSIVGADPGRGRGLVEWCRRRAPGERVIGYTDHLWNGLTTTEVATVIRGLLDGDIFAQARTEGPVHHLAQDPPITKFELLVAIVRAFDLPIDVEPRPSGGPRSRVLRARHRVVAGLLSPRVTLATALIDLAHRTAIGAGT